MSTADSVLDRSDEGVDRRFEARPDAVCEARHILRQWLVIGTALDGDHMDDLVLAASELAGNSVRAGATWFRLRAWSEDRSVVLEVTDDGPGFSGLLPGPGDLPPADAERGRGLYLVQSLVERWAVFSGESGTIVRGHLSNNH